MLAQGRDIFAENKRYYGRDQEKQVTWTFGVMD